MGESDASTQPIGPRRDNNITYRIHRNAVQHQSLARQPAGQESQQSSLLWSTLADQYRVTALSLNLKDQIRALEPEAKTASKSNRPIRIIAKTPDLKVDCN